MEWIEAYPLPSECKDCKEEECYNCDYAMKRWQLTEADELRNRRKSLEKAIERYQKQIKEIDRQLAAMEESEEENVMMTKEMFWECMDLCYSEGNMKKFWELWNEYPQYIQEIKDRYDIEMANPNSELRKREEKWFEETKARIAAELGEEWVKEHCK